MWYCRLLIHTYLPGELLPASVEDMYADEFLSLAAAARYARHMRQEDLKTAMVKALAEAFPA